MDDEDTVRNVATRFLDFLGFKAITATNGREALALFPSLEDVRFVFLDLTMPQMYGEETLRELRKLRPDLRVLVMSGYTTQDVASRFGNDPLVDFIQKPFNLDHVRKKIRCLLD